MPVRWESMRADILDHPNIRNSQYCPLCGGVKGAGPVVCWPCYHYHELRYGNLLIMEMIDRTERNWRPGEC